MGLIQAPTSNIIGVEERVELLGSLLLFIQYFYKQMHNREFLISHPIGRESHHITLCRQLTRVFYGKVSNLLINIPPGHHKSTILKYFVAWCWAHYPDCRFVYVSHNIDLATTHTHDIRKIVELPVYQKLFGIELRHDSKGKAEFHNKHGGGIKAFGSRTGIAGYDSGLPGLDRFSGASIIDDYHDPKDRNPEVIASQIVNYDRGLKQRRRSDTTEYFKTPQIALMQRVSQHEISEKFINGEDGEVWETVILKGLDDAGNALCPWIKSKEALLSLKKVDPYTFYSQYQQNPTPEGGSIFLEKDFVLMHEEPTILKTFITADTAETDKNYNDATAFSFWGIYNIHHLGAPTNIYGLHWLNCIEIRVSSDKLLGEFMQFYRDCLNHKVQPRDIIIEKKSTGRTLSDIVENNMQGLILYDMPRIKSKFERFRQSSPYVASRQVSLPINAPHTRLCIEHCGQITGNGAHAHDDIADTLADAIQAALIDFRVLQRPDNLLAADEIADDIMSNYLNQSLARSHANAHWIGKHHGI